MSNKSSSLGLSPMITLFNQKSGHVLIEIYDQDEMNENITFYFS